MERRFIAHIDVDSGREQTVREHLMAVSDLAGRFAAKAGLSLAGRLSGLLHDFGKYSRAFQDYIRQCAENSDRAADQDNDEYQSSAPGKGKIVTRQILLVWREAGYCATYGDIAGRGSAWGKGIREGLRENPQRPEAN